MPFWRLLNIKVWCHSEDCKIYVQCHFENCIKYVGCQSEDYLKYNVTLKTVNQIQIEDYITWEIDVTLKSGTVQKM